MIDNLKYSFIIPDIFSYVRDMESRNGATTFLPIIEEFIDGGTCICAVEIE